MAKKPAIRTRHDRRATHHPAIAAVSFTPAAAELADAALAPLAPDAEVFRPTLCGEIRPDPNNPRKLFDAEGLEQLAASIVRDGLLEPLVIRRVDGDTGFMLIAGERRWRAICRASEAGDWPPDRPIPAMVREVSEQDARRLALVENLQRCDLNAVEEARALSQLAEITGASAAQIGRDLGFTERWAQQRLSLLKLPDAVQTQIETGQIKVEHGRELVALLPKLPAVQQLAIERGTLSVEAAKAWLAEQPQPLSDAARLAMLELLEKAEAAPYKPNDYTSQQGVEIAARTEREDRGPNGVKIRVTVDVPELAELVKRDLLETPREQQVDGVEIGRHYVQRRFYSDGVLKGLIPEALNAKARPRLIAELRVKLHGLQRDYQLTESGEYATAWLNTPAAGELPAELQAKIDAARQARERQTSDYREQEKARAAERAAATAAQKAALESLEAAALAAMDAPDRTAAILALAADHGHALPWFYDSDSGHIVDAAGAVVMQSAYHYETDANRLGRQLLAHLVNAAAGLPTPDCRPTCQDPDAPSREAFVFQVAAALVEAADDEGLDAAGAQAQAEAGLAAFLREQAIEYADADFDWGPDGVEQLAHGIRIDDLGQQVDLEAAIAAFEVEAETSPALLALAGVPVGAAS